MKELVNEGKKIGIMEHQVVLRNYEFSNSSIANQKFHHPIIP